MPRQPVFNTGRDILRLSSQLENASGQSPLLPVEILTETLSGQCLPVGSRFEVSNGAGKPVQIQTIPKLIIEVGDRFQWHAGGLMGFNDTQGRIQVPGT